MRPPGNYDVAGILIRVDPDTLYSSAAVDMVHEAKVIIPHGGHGFPVPLQRIKEDPVHL